MNSGQRTIHQRTTGAAKPDETSAERKEASAMFSGPTQYGVAAVSGSLLIRVGSHVFCVRDTAK